MTQEVQTTLDYKAELNEVEWIWYQQRKISDKMQVRDKTSSQAVASWGTGSISSSSWEVEVWSWTITSSWWVDYKSSWPAIIAPQAWGYMLQFIPTWTYSQTTYYYTVRIKVDDKTIYSERSTLSDHSIRTMTVNLGKRNRVTVTFEAEWWAWAALSLNIKLIKL